MRWLAASLPQRKEGKFIISALLPIACFRFDKRDTDQSFNTVLNYLTILTICIDSNS